jgi:hypothetical protein
VFLAHAKKGDGKIQAQSIIITPIVNEEGTLGVIYINSKPNQAPFKPFGSYSFGYYGQRHID